MSSSQLQVASGSDSAETVTAAAAAADAARVQLKLAVADAGPPSESDAPGLCQAPGTRAVGTGIRLRAQPSDDDHSGAPPTVTVPPALRRLLPGDSHRD